MLIPVDNKSLIQEVIQPCPFCAKLPNVYEVRSVGAKVRYFVADSNAANCPMKAVRTKYYTSLEDAVSAWNERKGCR